MRRFAWPWVGGWLLASLYYVAPVGAEGPPPKAPPAAPGAPGATPGSPGHGGPLVHRFTNAADWVKKFEGPERDAWQQPQKVVELLGEISGKTVVDLGAGTGYFLPHLARGVGPTGKVLALDIEADMVRHMRDRVQREGLKNVEVRQVKGDRPGLPAASVDRVLIVDTWHHIADRVAYAKRLLEALSAGGALYIVDFTQESQYGPPKAHRLTAVQVMDELKAAGLAVELLKTTLAEQYVVVGRRPLAGSARP